MVLVLNFRCISTFIKTAINSRIISTKYNLKIRVDFRLKKEKEIIMPFSALSHSLQTLMASRVVVLNVPDVDAEN